MNAVVADPKTMLKENALADKERITALAQELGMSENDFGEKNREEFQIRLFVFGPSSRI